MTTIQTTIRLRRHGAGVYSYTTASGDTFDIYQVEGLTWQDPAYWVVRHNSKSVRYPDGRRRRFTRLHDVRVWLESELRGKGL